MKIAIQGIRGSNHHEVACSYYSQNTELVECLSFEEMVDRLVCGDAEQGVMAIENSIAGSIIPNYALIYKNNLHVVGEYYLGIRHHLMALEGQDVNDLTEVRSHPMALLQCMSYLKGLDGIRLVEDVDTAETARLISKERLRGIAAIAPRMAAELYGLQILCEDIQTIKNNATRFIMISPKAIADGEGTNIDKASLRFVTEHKRGSLATVLNVMSDCNLNLTKIQSLPIIETPWKYAFFVDVTFDDPVHFYKAESLLKIMSEDFRVLGLYKNALSL